MASADTTIFKFIAILLIANSHMERLYPRPWMAGDGLLGMTGFFAVAGFGLALSEGLKPRSFLPWYWRRVVRIYPALLLTVLVADVWIGGGWRTWGAPEYVRRLVWPTWFTFIAIVMPAYAVFFPFMKARGGRGYRVGIVGAAIALLVLWAFELKAAGADARPGAGRGPMVGCFLYLLMMFVGGWLATRVNDGRARRIRRARRAPQDRLDMRGDAGARPTSLKDVAILAALFAGYVATKYQMVVRGHLAWAYPLLYPFPLLMALYLFRLCGSRRLLEFVHQPDTMPAPLRPASAVVAFIAGLTLEIYLVHGYVLESRPVQSLRFPLNIAIFWPRRPDPGDLPRSRIRPGKPAGAVASVPAEHRDLLAADDHAGVPGVARGQAGCWYTAAVAGRPSGRRAGAAAARAVAIAGFAPVPARFLAFVPPQLAGRIFWRCRRRRRRAIQGAWQKQRTPPLPPAPATLPPAPAKISRTTRASRSNRATPS